MAKRVPRSHGQVLLQRTLLPAGGAALILLALLSRQFAKHPEKAKQQQQQAPDSSPRPASESEFIIQYTPTGCVYLPADSPICAADNVCFADGRATFFIRPFPSESWPWLADRHNISADTEASLEHAWKTFERRCCRYRSGAPAVSGCLRAERLGFTCCRQYYKTINHPALLLNPGLFVDPAHALVLDTAVNFFQFGHAISKVLQYASFALWASRLSPPSSGYCQRPRISLGLFSRIQDRSIPDTILEWLNVVANLESVTLAAAPDPVRFTTLTKVLVDGDRCRDQDGTSHCGRSHASSSSSSSFASSSSYSASSSSARACVKRAYFFLDYEQYYFRDADALQVNDELERTMHLPACPDSGKSAARKGMLLLRAEGSGGRRLANARSALGVIEKAFNIGVENVTIDSSMGVQRQLREFRSHGLIVAPHSSQLKNLAAACPCTIALEINALDGSRQPFSVGLQHRNVVYVQSANHTPENYGRPINQNDLRTYDVLVNLTKLETDVNEAILEHRRRGCRVF